MGQQRTSGKSDVYDCLVLLLCSWRCGGAGADRPPCQAEEASDFRRGGSASGCTCCCRAALEHRQHPHYGQPERRLWLHTWGWAAHSRTTYWPAVHLAHRRRSWYDNFQHRLCLRQVRVTAWVCNYAPAVIKPASDRWQVKYVVLSLVFDATRIVIRVGST